ncbi:MAG: hypothetical protein NUW37_19825 [Planctomycetes bacterium]|nr:hypothetical protein [Planctomycetota bacterium]
MHIHTPFLPRSRDLAIAALIFVLAFSLSAPAFAEDASPFAEMLGSAGLTEDSAQLPANRWRGGGPHSLPLFDRLWDDWRLLDPETERTRNVLSAAGGSFGKLLAAGSEKLDVAIDDARMEELRAEVSPALLPEAIARIHERAGTPLSGDEFAALKTSARNVPLSVNIIASVVLTRINVALDRLDAALGDVASDPARRRAWFYSALRLALFQGFDDETLHLLSDFDLRQMIEGAALLADAMDEAAQLISKDLGGMDFEFAHETPYGWIVLNGDNDDVYDIEHYLLIVDTGGNDNYGSGATTEHFDCPVSLLIDKAGNDVYSVEKGGAFGVGFLGYGMLADLAGDDSYYCEENGISAAGAGVGMLVDYEGQDSYKSRRLTQGAAALGVSVLYDGAGDDNYWTVCQGQGYGAVKGCGVLVDTGGNDTYIADDETVIYPSAQTAEHNASMSQGAGFGRRGNAENSLAGGCGILIDTAGDDTYSSGLFAQGVAYWYAIGMLIDLEGNDTHKGVWYVCGSTAHYAIASLRDESGDDSYTSTMNQSIGAAHDYSLTLFRDLAGNDRYNGTGNAIGLALWNSVAIFRDDEGDDKYETRSGLGLSGAHRPEHLNLGIFYDGAGTDVYPARYSDAKPGEIWVRPLAENHPQGIGVGRDVGNPEETSEGE